MYDHEAIYKLAMTIVFNQVMAEFEPAYRYTHSGMRTFIHDTKESFSYSVKQGAHFVPAADRDVDDYLIAFEEFTRDADTEYMMMGVGEPASTNLLSVALERGSTVSVGWPLAGIRNLKHRLNNGHRSRLIAVHNHPKGLLHELLRLLQFGLPGASDRDRDVSFQWMLHSISSNTVIPEFYLVEDGHFRRILAPSWPTLVSLLRPLFDSNR
jgi:hypothetical protein